MTREEKISRLKDILSEINENDNAVCYLTSEDSELIESAIKALEQQPCEDCISREQAVDAVADLFEMSEYPHPYPQGKPIRLKDIKEKLKQLPPVQPKIKTEHWIPVSERLPKDIKPVIVTWKNTDPKSYYQYIVGKHFIGTAHYKNGKWFWYSSVTEDLLAEYGRCDSEEFDEAIEVIAWMPLPEPYEPQESEDKE